ncbi:MAG: hypothetical protein AB1894_15900 [Chloroflexota bacterium]
MRNKFYFLSVYAIAIKIFSVFTFITGIIGCAFAIYLWGKISAFYDVARTALNTFENSLLGVSGSNVPVAQLQPLSIWPILVFSTLLLIGAVITSLTLWAIGQWIDFRMSIAEEENHARAIQIKTLNALAHDMAIVSNYFASLPAHRGK